jgi:hypothetical protein
LGVTDDLPETEEVEMSAREPLVSGWFRDKEEGLLMKCVWQRTVPRGESGEEALRTVWLCEDSRGFSVRVEEVDAGGQRHVLWHTRPIPEGLLRTDIRNVARVARGIREAARALSGWISQSGILEGAEGLELRVEAGEGVTVEILCEKDCGTPRVSLTIWPIELRLPLEDWDAVEALARALE